MTSRHKQRHAVILAGGKGVRLRPYTTRLPKPLVPIGEQYSILEIILSQLSRQGFDSITLAIGHLGPLIKAFVGDGSRWGLNIHYEQEETPLGTIGPLLCFRDFLPEHFIVMNGDVLTNLDYAAMLDRHIVSAAPLTIATFEREVRIDFGVLQSNDGLITAFQEKPALNYAVSMGVYALSKRTLTGYPAGQPFGFDDLVLDLLARNTAPASHPFEGYWLDIGRPDDYDQANQQFESLKDLLLPDLKDTQPDLKREHEPRLVPIA